MVIRGMTISLPWFAFINVSFALIILLRRVLFNDLTPPWLNEKSLIHSIDISATGILLICSGLLLIPRQKTLPIQVLLVALSLLWSWCSYHFIAYWTLQFAYPLCVLLMLSGVIALYFHTPSLLAFVIPLWFTTPIASLMLNQQINIHFAVVWCIFSLALYGGRLILLRWFEEAWVQNSYNNQLINRLDALAHRDPLTGIANRRAMNSILHDAIDNGGSFALIMLDVDFFKRYNDTYGHPAGDRCLIQVADALQRSTRQSEDVVVRYGGEEFVIILFNATLPEAETVAARVKQELKLAAIPHQASAVNAFVTVSQGITCSAPAKTAEQIISDADAALYRVKESGRNRWEK
ncbi:TPA: membrane-associated sensor domain-containing protein [Escherichia coli]|uniref:GGDEF domain-containing protein n=1 Tax=Escherichia coli TaxID=562 RepID=UPI001CDB2629|nr:GGDEF domain-containing protein [Escherichia coli]